MLLYHRNYKQGEINGRIQVPRWRNRRRNETFRMCACRCRRTVGRASRLGKARTGKCEHLPCDHVLVIMFTPFTAFWHQIIGVFASRGNMKAELLSKILVEAILLAQKAALKVDYMTAAEASWNRSMWCLFGISGSSTSIKPSATHPVDPGRRFFISDFLHLVKCV